METLRILMLSPHPGIRTPLAKHTPHLVRALEALGCEVSLESWGRHREGESVAEKLVLRFRDIWRIRRLLKIRPFDVLIVKTAHDWSTLSRDVPLLLTTGHLVARTVLQFHGSWSDRLVAPGHRFFKFATRQLLRLADAALVLSSQECEEWQRFYPTGDFHVVSNPYVSEEFPEMGQGGFCDDGGSGVILFVGRLIEQKGILELLEAVARLRGETPWRLAVVGDGDLAERIVERARNLGIAARVSLHGYLTGMALARAYRCAEIFALPSASEGFPVAITEAMHAGLPIVTTPLRGMADHLREGENALFVPPRDPEALAAALIRLLSDAELRRRMGRANAEKVKEFSPEIVGRQYLDVLRQVAGGPVT